MCACAACSRRSGGGGGSNSCSGDNSGDGGSGGSAAAASSFSRSTALCLAVSALTLNPHPFLPSTQPQHHNPIKNNNTRPASTSPA